MARADGARADGARAEAARAARLRAVRERARGGGAEPEEESAARAAPLADLLAAREAVQRAARETFLPAPPVRVPDRRGRRDGRAAWIVATVLVVALVVAAVWFLVARSGQGTDQGAGDQGAAQPSGQQQPGASHPGATSQPGRAGSGAPTSTAARTSQGSPKPPPPATAKPPASTTAGNPMNAAAMTTFIRDYYLLAVRKPNEAWKRIGPGDIRDRGRGRYLQFWNGVRRVGVAGLSADPAHRTVTATLTFTDKNGTHPPEHHTLSLTTTDGGTGLLITHDQNG